MDQVTAIYVQADLGRRRRQRLPSLDRWSGLIFQCTDDELSELTGTAKHQGIAVRVAVAGPMGERDAYSWLESRDNPLVLVLDGVQDPRNFGACLRTADAAGVDLVVTGRSRNVGVTPVVSKVAAGAAELQPLATVANLARFLAGLQEQSFQVVGLAGEAETSVYGAALSVPLAIVVGAEGEGLRRLTRERCSLLVSVPLLGTVESLNLSVAAGVCLFEARRQIGQLAGPAALR